MLPRKGLIFHLKCVNFLALVVVDTASGCESGTGEAALSKVTNALNLLKGKRMFDSTVLFLSFVMRLG